MFIDPNQSFDGILSESAYRVGPFYHGTRLKNLISILRTGLIPGTGYDYADKTTRKYPAVYITHDLDQAAGYGAWEDRLTDKSSNKFVILEIYISKSRRINNLHYDTLDRSDEAWDFQTDGFESEDYETENKLEKFVSNIYEEIQRQIPHLNLNIHRIKSFIKSYEDLDRWVPYVNLIRDMSSSIIEYVRDSKRQITDMEIKKIREIISHMIQSPPDLGYIYITNDGSLKLNNDYYNSDTKEQLEYINKITPQMIKGVYISSKIIPNGVRETVTPMKTAPEVAYEFEEKEESIRDLQKKLPSIIEGSLDDPEYIISEITEEFLGLDEDIDPKILDLVSRLKSGEFQSEEDPTQIDYDKIDPVVEDILETSMYIVDDLYARRGEEAERLPPVEMTYVPLPDAASKESFIRDLEQYRLTRKKK